MQRVEGEYVPKFIFYIRHGQMRSKDRAQAPPVGCDAAIIKRRFASADGSYSAAQCGVTLFFAAEFRPRAYFVLPRDAQMARQESTCFDLSYVCDKAHVLAHISGSKESRTVFINGGKLRSSCPDGGKCCPSFQTALITRLPWGPIQLSLRAVDFRVPGHALLTVHVEVERALTAAALRLQRLVHAPNMCPCARVCRQRKQ